MSPVPIAITAALPSELLAWILAHDAHPLTLIVVSMLPLRIAPGQVEAMRNSCAYVHHLRRGPSIRREVFQKKEDSKG